MRKQDNLRTDEHFASGRDYYRESDSWDSGTLDHFGKGPKGWKRSDEKIKDDVCEALYRNQRVDATDIEVLVNQGVVTLRGNIETRDGKRHAEACVEHITGVEDIQNEITVGKASKASLS